MKASYNRRIQDKKGVLYMAKQNMTITERDRRAIFLVAKLNDKELFGLECYLAGTRAAAGSQNRKQDRTAASERMPEGAVV